MQPGRAASVDSISRRWIVGSPLTQQANEGEWQPFATCSASKRHPAETMSSDETGCLLTCALGIIWRGP